MVRLVALALAAVFLLPAAAEAATVKVFLMRGEQLASLDRTVAKKDPTAALNALLSGPGPAERKAGYGTAIPTGIALMEARVDEEREIVHLRFGPGLTALKDAEMDGARLAQIIYTAFEVTGFDRVSVRTPERARKTYDKDDFAPPPYVEPTPKREKIPAPKKPRDVQVQLAALGYLPADAVTGTWDYRTKQAVLAFQSWEGLERDGVVGPMTLARMETAGRPLAIDRGPGRRVEIYRQRGVVLLVSGARVVRAIHTSTGVGGDSVDLGTPPGRFKIYRKEPRSWSIPYKTWLPFAAYWVGGWALHGYADVPAAAGLARLRAAADARGEDRLRLRQGRHAGPRHLTSGAWRHPSPAAGARRSSRSTTSPPCSRPSRAICAASSASATGSCARPAAAEALGALKELVTRGEQVALLVADQRMPGLSGTEYLVEARKLVPDAKRVLLTAYADTEAAIQAINEVDLDYYLLKPWDPPEEQLYPVVEDLLTTWEAGAALESGGVRVIGHRFSRDSHDLRDFLARNRVPMRWLDVERDSEARELLTVTGVDSERAAGGAAGGRHGARAPDRAGARGAARRVRGARRPSTTTW